MAFSSSIFSSGDTCVAISGTKCQDSATPTAIDYIRGQDNATCALSPLSRRQENGFRSFIFRFHLRRVLIKRTNNSVDKS